VILVDTSIWIDHLHESDRHLTDLLLADLVGVHPVVVEELALGSIADRPQMLELLGSLRRLPALGHDELLAFVAANRLWGRGLSAADAHLLGSVLLGSGDELWTRDRRLQQAAVEHGVGHAP
jgi:hypothetical protein